MSLLILLVPSLGCSWLLAVIDCLSKMVWLFPIPAKEAHHVFEALITLFDRYGMVMLFLKVIVGSSGGNSNGQPNLSFHTIY